MQIKNILHVALRTMDIDATNKFYTDVLRLQVDPNRPDSIPAPGTWLNFGDRQIHVIAGPKAYGDFDHKTYGGGNLDHMAIRAVGFDAWKEHLTKHGVDYRQNNVRAMGQWQLFYPRSERNRDRAAIHRGKRACRRQRSRRDQALHVRLFLEPVHAPRQAEMQPRQPRGEIPRLPGPVPAVQGGI